MRQSTPTADEAHPGLTARAEAAEPKSIVLSPRKARILLMIGLVAAGHIVLLLLFWPHRWPAAYKWLLLPDGIGIYMLIALAVSNLLKKETSGKPASRNQ